MLIFLFVSYNIDMSNIKSQIIQPVVHSNFRSELRLDPYKQYTNLRIINLGCSTTGTDASYCDSCGVYGLIQHAYLMNGNDVIDQLLDAHKMLSFTNLYYGEGGKDNGLDYSLYSNLNLSSRSYKQSAATGTTIEKLPAGVVNPEQNVVTQDDTTTTLGWIHCSRLFGLLKKLPVLDTSIMHNLRVVIEWRTQPSAIFAGDASGITALTVLPPLLMADEVEGVQMPKQVVFNRFELERIQLAYETAQPPGNAPVKKDTRVRCLAFNGHIVNRVLMMNIDRSKEASNAVTDCLKGNCSEALEGELIQFQLNGQNILPFDGVSTAQRKHHHLLQSWGIVNVVQGAQFNARKLDGTSVLNSFYDDSNTQAMVGRQSYGGFSLGGQRVEELNLVHSRLATNDKYGPIELSLYGEVPMVLSFEGDSYSIAFL